MYVLSIPYVLAVVRGPVTDLGASDLQDEARTLACAGPICQDLPGKFGSPANSRFFQH